MVVIWQDLLVHFPEDLAGLVFDYGDQLENALASIAASGREFWHIYCLSGVRIDAVSKIMQDEYGCFNTITRPCKHEISFWGKSLPGYANIYWLVDSEDETSFHGRRFSLGYGLWCATEELLRYGKTTSRRRRNRRKKLQAARAGRPRSLR